MGILSRFKDIVSSNVNALLDKCENPEKMVDQYLRKAMDDLAEVKKETAGVMAAETSAKRDLDKAKGDVEKYSNLAKKAITAGNEDDARTFIAKKQELEANVANLQKTYDVAHNNAVQMRQMHDKLTNDIKSLKARSETVKGQMAVAKTQQTINKAAETGSKISGTMGAFARMEEKAQRALDEANAVKELNEAPKDDVAEAEAKYSGVNDTSVDDELARLKTEMGV